LKIFSETRSFLSLRGAIATWQSQKHRLFQDFIPRNDTGFTEYLPFFCQLNNNRYFVKIFTNTDKKRLSLPSSKSTRPCETHHNLRQSIISTLSFIVKHFIITFSTIVTLLTILYYIILLCQGSC